MKNFVITIPVDENLEGCIYELAYRLYVQHTEVTNTLIDNDPDALFQIFDDMGDRDLGIEYGFGLEITGDKPIASAHVVAQGMKTLRDYGLDLIADLESELNRLQDKPLLELLNDVVASVRFRTSFVSYVLSSEADEQIQKLTTTKRCALIRWVCDRIELKLMEAAK